jgi:hypothetical protein
MAVGVYPGSFNPPTVAHLAIAEAAVRQCGLDRVDLALARRPLGKDAAGPAALDERRAVLEAVAASRSWLGVVVTGHRLVVDIARGYDVVVMGADKWAQVTDPAWYGDDPAARDRAVAALPRLAVAPRAASDLVAGALPEGAVVLDVHPDHHHVSATGVRQGRHDWLVPEAAPLVRPEWRPGSPPDDRRA